MNIPTPPRFRERRGIRSGRIYRKGSSPDQVEYGVIFTHDDCSADEPDPSIEDCRPEVYFQKYFDTNKILSASLCNIDSVVEDEKVLFKILGGYYYKVDSDTTTKVFGKALESEFGIQENGDITLNDNWLLNDARKPKLDEKNIGKRSGWTFIVELKEVEYPHSDNLLKIVVACSEVKVTNVEIGDCIYDSERRQLKREVTFRTEISGPEPRKWSWSFGDGESASDFGAPPIKIKHLYAKKPAERAELCVEGHPVCERVCHKVDLTEFDNFVECPICPNIVAVDNEYGDCKTEGGVRLRQVIFSISFEGDAPVSWTLEFGDGKKQDGSGKPPAKIKHYYAHKPDVPAKFTLVGPGACEQTSREVKLADFPECEPCAKVKRIDQSLEDEDNDSRSVKFNVIYVGAKPVRFEWNWGDGTSETTVNSSALHKYKRPGSGASHHDVSVRAIGPQECKDSGETEVDISAFTPPRFCFIFPLLVAFFAALTAGLPVMSFVVSLFEKAANVDRLNQLFFIFLILTILAAILWYLIARKFECRAPGKCDWMAIAATALLTAAIVAIYLADCTANWWLALIIITLAISIFLFYNWYRRCIGEIRDIILHVIIGIISAAILFYLVAMSLFAQC